MADRRSVYAPSGRGVPQLGQDISFGCIEPFFISKVAVHVQVIFTFVNDFSFIYYFQHGGTDKGIIPSAAGNDKLLGIY